jgi:Ran GTPase-activating protein (RanGAP) involved in mRNA processing and transport
MDDWLRRVRENDASLTVLDLALFLGGEDAIGDLAAALEGNSAVRVLNLVNNELALEGARGLAQILAHNTTISELDVGANNLGFDKAAPVRALAPALEVNTSLRSLRAWSNELKDEGCLELARALQQNTSLTSLDIGTNGITVVGLLGLCQGLQTSQTLRSLDVGGNHLGDAGAIALSQALLGIRTLRTLMLSRNNINSLGTNALAELFDANQSLTAVDLRQGIFGRRNYTQH